MTNKTTKEHYEKYSGIAKKGGFSLAGKDEFMGRTKKEWIELYNEDEHLNNVPLKEWDIHFFNPWVRQNGVNSLCDCVCLYKHMVKYDIIGVTPDFEVKQ